MSDEKQQPASFRDYGTQVIEESLQAMLSHAEGVRHGEDIEALHDMRVASRRLRAAIGVFTAAYPDPKFERFERDVKAVTDALGEARDLDVMIETLEKLDESLAENERDGLEAFIAEKRKMRAKRQKSVRKALDRLEKRGLARRFAEIAARCDTSTGWLYIPQVLEGDETVSSPSDSEEVSEENS
jgi:CHAD domain-containing protein